MHHTTTHNATSRNDDKPTRKGRKSCTREDSPTASLTLASSSLSILLTPRYASRSQPIDRMTPQEREERAWEFILKKGFDFTYDDLDKLGQLRANRLMSNDYCWTPTKDDATETW